MEHLRPLISSECFDEMERLHKLPLDLDVNLKQWKGCNFIPGFSPEAAQYAYNEWSMREGDVFVLSYPKTGTHWGMEIVRRILFQDEMLDTLTKSFPIHLGFVELDPIAQYHLMDKLPLPRRLMGSHLPAELFNVEKVKKANAKVVYVLRNPKDQMVSWLKFAQKLPLGQVEPTKSLISSGWDDYFHHTIAGKFLMNMKPGEWYPDHILGWYKHRDNKNVYFLYYEDLKKDLFKEINRLSDFLDASLTEEVARKIADGCTFDNMKEQVTKESVPTSSINAINMRKGTVGGWKDYFTVAQSEKIDEIMEEKLRGTDVKFTYQL